MSKEHPTQLKPLTKQPAVFNLGSFDIEGVGGPNGFVLAGLLTESEYQTFTQPHTLLDHIRQRQFKGYRFFAHNLTYDYGLLESSTEIDDYPLLINGRVFKVRLKRGNHNPRYLADSLLFSAGLSLAKLGSALGYPKEQTPSNLIEYEPAVDPHQRFILREDKTVQKYLYRDCEIVLKYMNFFQSTINQLGGEMKFTLASTAMDLFRRAYLDNTYFTPFVARNQFARHAYYGGRVEPFRTGEWSGVNCYDINSLYPYVMYHFPYPNPNTLHGPQATTDPSVIWRYEGVSTVKIYVPETIIPPLPYRHKGKLFFPTGLLAGTYTHAELRYALEQGCQLRDITRTMYTTEVCYPFQRYVTDLYAKRQAFKQANDPRQLVIKILLNSLYGKFGQRQDAGLQEIKPITWWLAQDKKPSVDWREIDGEVYVLLSKGSDRQPQYINVLWAAYITSYARLTLLGYMNQVKDNLVYVDTDSVYIQDTLDTSLELGAMKLEHENIDIEVYGPKAYRLFKAGELVTVKCKGVPAPNRNEYLTSGSTTFKRPTGLLEANRLRDEHGAIRFYPSQWREVTKQNHATAPKRYPLPAEKSHPDQRLTVPHSVDSLPD